MSLNSNNTNTTYRVLELPFYEGESFENIIQWFHYNRLAFISNEKIFECLNARSSVYLLRCLRNSKTGYQGYMFDGISFKRHFKVTDKKRSFGKDVDLYLDIRDQHGNINFDNEGTKNSGSPHCEYYGVPYDRGNDIDCTAVLFETPEAREKCYQSMHPDMCIEIISRICCT